MKSKTVYLDWKEFRDSALEPLNDLLADHGLELVILPEKYPTDEYRVRVKHSK